MSDGAEVGTVDIGEFCRQVEACLSRANDGHLVRIVGVGFDLVRGWALEGIPLSVVCRGIEMKAERHRAGTSRRPVRIEFCEGDVRALYDDWRRAVGLHAAGAPSNVAAVPSPSEERRRPSIGKHLDRAMERLVRVSGRIELPAPFLETVARVLSEASAVREELVHARGTARDTLIARLPALDRALADAAGLALDPGDRDRLRGEAEQDLSAYRGRLDADTWRQSVTAGTERLIREHFGLPTLEPPL